MKKENGVAGLNLLLSIITLLFVIGLIVMVFSLMGGSISDATSETTSDVVADEQIANFTDGGTALSVEPLDGLEVTDVIVEGCI